MIQLQVLNKILATKDSSLITLNNLNEDYFTDYKSEFKFIKTHLDAYGNVPDIETFLSTFNKFEVISVNESSSYLLEELVKDKNTRYLANTFNKVRDLLMNGKTDEAISLYTNAHEKLASSTVLESVDILKDTSRYDDYVSRTQDFGKYYVSTGFRELDELIGGWDRTEELATIVARTNVGKSWALLQCAVASAKQGLNVGIYSGEMSERKVGYRVDTLIGHISNGSLVHGNANVQQDYKQYIDNVLPTIKGSIKVLTPQKINGPAGVNALRTFIEKDKLDILFVDQHSLLEDDRKAKNPVERAANISKDLKNLQVMKRIPIISVSQQNRTKNEDNVVDTTQIAQTDRIGQDSTVIIFLEKKDEDIIKMSLVKSRDSANGKELSYQVDFNTGTFTYIPSEDDATGGNSEISYEHRYNVETSSGEDVF